MFKPDYFESGRQTCRALAILLSCIFCILRALIINFGSSLFSVGNGIELLLLK